ncbi:MAG TPA: putative Ig domain-containing protein, partial [Planctomycetota bacterium]|nr:putative Ig domain-containing protein [Planctomycetota bacterium]
LVSAPATVTITVTPVNDAPAFGPSVPAGITVLLVGQAFSFTFSASDSDLDSLSYTLVSGPSWLSMDAATGVLSGTPNRRAHLATDTVIVRVDDGLGGKDEHAFQLTVQGQVIVLGSALPVPVTKATFTDASGDLVSVGAKGLGTFYLVRGVAPDAGGAYSNGTPGDLVTIEAEGTNSKSAVTFKVSSPVKAPLPVTSVGDIVVAGSLGTFGGAQVSLLGGLSATGSVAKLTLGDVTASRGLTMGTDPLIASASVAFGRVQDTRFTSGTPLKSLALSEWLDTDATPDALIAPWVSSLATKRSKIAGGPMGDFQASVTLSGAGATKGTLGKVSIAGSMRGGTWDIAGAAGSLAVGGSFTNCTFRATALKSLTVAGTIREDASDGDTDVIHVLTGVFSAGDLTWRGSIPPEHWFGGLRAFVG